MKSLVLVSALAFFVSTLVIAEILHGLRMVWKTIRALCSHAS